MFKLNVKDIITSGVFSALYFLCVGIGTFLGAVIFAKANMMYAPALSALFAGLVYLLLIKKTGKFGPITIVGIVMGCFFFFSGHFGLSLFTNIIFAIIADFVAKIKDYKSKVVNIISYIIFSYGNFGPILLMWVSKDLYIQKLLDKGKDYDYINKVMIPFEWSIALKLIFIIFVCALIGGLFGNYLLEKHFKNERNAN